MTMKNLLVLLMFVSVVSINFASNADSIKEDVNVVLKQGRANLEIESTPEIPENIKQIDKERNQQSGKSLKEQAEEIPVVFGQWWFWVGLFVVILFLKLVIFKK